MMVKRKLPLLEPNEHGNYLCPYCSHALTPVFKEWLNTITDYICHRCKKRFNVFKSGIKSKNFLDLESFS